jgi:CRISPR-associated endonuclease Cas2
MARPKDVSYNLKDRLEKMVKAGLTFNDEQEKTADPLLSLNERLKIILEIVKSKPIKSTSMTYLIMYDIENNKVRSRISKYLEKKGCIRIQKSIFMTNSAAKEFSEIHQTLVEVQSYYENNDSIMLVPFNTSDIRSMKIIGKEINIQTLVDKPTTLFF